MRLGENFCPGVLHAVPAKDGLLMRIRVPGGLIEAHQLRSLAALAAEFADGTLEITSRANLQLRAIRAENLAQITQAVAYCGLLPSPLHDRVRNIVSSPIAGLDPYEIVDPRVAVRELDRALIANPLFAALHPKFSFGIFGGRRRFSLDADDLTLEALAPTSFRLTIAGAVTSFLVTASEAVDRLLNAAEVCLAIAQESGVPGRAKKIAAIPGAIERIAANLAPIPLPGKSFVEPLLGTYPAAEGDSVNIVPSVELGRITSAQAFRLADMADFWLADLRLAPWRGVVFGGVPFEFAEAIADQLAAIGLACDGADGFRGIAACAGIAGCDAALTDVRAHAAALARVLRNHTAPNGWSVNLSGCDKRCAMRNGATVELVATPSGYNLKLDGAPLRPGCSSEAAIDLAVSSLSGEPRPESEL